MIFVDDLQKSFIYLDERDENSNKLASKRKRWRYWAAKINKAKIDLYVATLKIISHGSLIILLVPVIQQRDFKSQMQFPGHTHTHTQKRKTETADPGFSAPAVWREGLQEVGCPFTQSHNQSAWVHSPELLEKKGGKEKAKATRQEREILLPHSDYSHFVRTEM